MKVRTKAFDRPDQDSAFLSFIATEFRKHGTPRRKILADKTRVGSLISGLGLKQPKRLAEFSDINQINDTALPESFALKYAHGWSARGVMLLKRVDEDQFFCMLNHRIMTWSQVVETQLAAAASFARKADFWIVEELVTSTVSGKPIPFDYKFYCFRSEIAFIVQIDRNTYPVKICLLKPDFSPLEHKSDYVLKSRNAQLGTPLVPLHAIHLVEWAKTLSVFTGSPFVSVDLYDSLQGPVFGEFTFSPGGMHKRLWVLERSLLDRLDKLFAKAEADLAAGGEAPSTTPSGLPSLASSAECEIYGILTSAVLNGSTRAATRMWEMLQARSEESQRDYVESWHQISQFLKARADNAHRNYIGLLDL
jgi:hypothetical protein